MSPLELGIVRWLVIYPALFSVAIAAILLTLWLAVEGYQRVKRWFA